MNKENKIFKTINEQIDLLKYRGFNVKNINRLSYYLKFYNYQNFINGYNDPFLKNFQRKSNRYNEGVNESSIIDLFNFDRSIGPLLLSNIQNIERGFSSSMAYEIAKELNRNLIDDGHIFKINNECKKIFKCEKISEKLQISLSKNFEKNKSNLQNKYKLNNNFDGEKWVWNVPIWTLSIYWSFGDAIKIFESLNKNIKKSIISSVFENKFENIGEFIKIICMLKNIRNRICHNNVLYNIEVKNNEDVFLKFLKRHIDYKSNKIKLSDVVKIIDIISEKKEYKLWTIFSLKVKSKIIDSKNLMDSSKNFILNQMNFPK